MFRRVLVIIQFTLSIVMIIGTLIISRQVEFVRNRNLGLNKENLGYLWMSGEFRAKHEIAKAELLKNPAIKDITVTSQLPTYVGSSTSGWGWEGKPEDLDVLMHFISVDQDYARTFQLEMTEGRFFSREYATDSIGVVVNETAVDVMGMDSPVGKRLSNGEDFLTIIGVVRDFHFKPVQTKIEPLVMLMIPNRYYAMVMRTRTGDPSETVGYVEEIYKKFNPERPFQYNFLDKDYERMYRTEERIGLISASFAVIAILIACLGLYGLASYMAELRMKEIGIRKILGASIPVIFVLLSREFVLLTGIANLVAWPVAFYVMSDWLEGYAYRAELDLMVFVFAAAIAFGIVLATVSYQALRVARGNPVDALRYE